MDPEFLTAPKLPRGMVTEAIVSSRMPRILQELENHYHITALVPRPLPQIVGEERFHADMCVCHIGGSRFYLSGQDQPLQEQLSALGGETIVVNEITAAMPKLNVCLLKDKLLYCRKSADKALLRECQDRGFREIAVRQRYTGCSCAVVSDNALITQDESVYRACLNNGIDVLKIRPGYIALPGYEYGFIGGCCGLLCPELLAFSGNIGSHPDYENIRAFCREYGVAVTALSKERLYDIGGIVPIRERLST